MGHDMHTSRLLRPGLLVLLLGGALAACTQPQTGPATAANGRPGDVMNVADAAISGGDPAMALKVAQAALANDPNNLDALYHEGAAYYALDRCMDAIAVYKVALGVDSKSAQAEVGIGRCLLKRNAIEAEQAFEAAVQDDPDNAAALNDLGVSRDLQGNHAGAVQPYQQALLLKPGEISTEVNLGMSLALSGDGSDALQYLGPLATSQDATPKIREDYAAALLAAGRPDQARTVLAVDLPPPQVDSLLADFSAAIAAGQATASAAAAPSAPALPVAPATALIHATPLASAASAPAAAAALAPAQTVTAAQAAVTQPVAAPEVAAPVVAAMAAPSTPAAAPPTVVTAPAPAAETASAAPVAMPPAALPSASLAAPSTAPTVTPPPGASAAGTSDLPAATDQIVR
jgi:Flp pilus assembly protein TadD